jgi:AraC-like DNA-binding protein/quercetin dioxygenase-like cupin family protein
MDGLIDGQVNLITTLRLCHKGVEVALTEPSKNSIILSLPPLVKKLRHKQLFEDPAFRLRAMRIPRHGAVSDPHCHDFDELVVVLDGHGKHFVGSETYDFGAGDVFVILQGMSHCYPEAKDFSLINIIYDTDQIRMPRADLRSVSGYQALFELEPRLRARSHFKNRLKLSLEELGKMLKIVAEMEEELNGNTPGHRFVATAHFIRLIGWLSRAYSKLPRDEPRSVTQISRVLGYIETNYTGPLSVETLSRVAGMSQSSLFRTFQQILGRLPIYHVMHLRMEKATRLLARTRMRVGEISYSVGFNDSNYFTRQFRAVYGCSPREYREREGHALEI